MKWQNFDGVLIGNGEEERLDMHYSTTSENIMEWLAVRRFVEEIENVKT